MKKALLIGVSIAAISLLILLIIVSWPTQQSGDEPEPESEDVSSPTEIGWPIWELMNARCRLGHKTWPMIDVAFCRVLDPHSSNHERQHYLEVLRRLGAINFDDEQINRLVASLRDESADIKIGLIRGLTADSEGGIHIMLITTDRERMRLFLWGEHIPVE